MEVSGRKYKNVHIYVLMNLNFKPSKKSYVQVSENIEVNHARIFFFAKVHVLIDLKLTHAKEKMKPAR